MRKSIITIVTALLLTAPLRAEGELHRYGLVQLPHPVGKLAAEPERFQLTPEQQEGVEAIVAEVPAKMHAMLEAAKEKEEAIRRAVLAGGARGAEAPHLGVSCRGAQPPAGRSDAGSVPGGNRS